MATNTRSEYSAQELVGRLTRREAGWLVVSRMVYRFCFLLSNALLFYLWSETMFSAMAVQVGQLLVIVPLLVLGFDRLSLKLIPRSKRSRQLLVQCQVFIQGFVILLACTVYVVVSQIYGLSELSAAAFLFTCGNASLISLQSLARAVGFASWECLSNMALGALTLLVTGLVLCDIVGSAGYLYCIAGGTLIASIVLALRSTGLDFWVPQRFATGLNLMMIREGWLLSLNSILGSASISVLYLMLANSTHVDQAGLLSIVLGVFGAIFSFGQYLMRMLLPVWSLRFRRAEPPLGNSLLYTMSAGLCGIMAIALGFAGEFGDQQDFLQIVILVVAMTPVALVVEVMVARFECLDIQGIRFSSVAISAGLVTACLLGAISIGSLGVAGVVVALIAGDLVTGGALFFLGNRLGRRAIA